MALATPIVRASPITASLPDVIEWYVIPVTGRSTFTLFPWSGFLIAGAAVGVVLDRARGIAAERRLVGRMAAGGAALAAAAYAGSYLPSVFAASSFWTTSPAFFFVRLGILVLLVPMAFVWMSLGRTASPVRELGWSSLFVYWIHLELVYGSPSRPLHRALTVEQAAIAFGLFTLVLYVMVRLKHRLWDGAGAAGAAVRNMAQRQASPGHSAS